MRSDGSGKKERNEQGIRLSYCRNGLEKPVLWDPLKNKVTIHSPFLKNLSQRSF